MKNLVWLKQSVNFTESNPKHINLYCFGCFVYWEDQNIFGLGGEELPLFTTLKASSKHIHLPSSSGYYCAFTFFDHIGVPFTE